MPRPPVPQPEWIDPGFGEGLPAPGDFRGPPPPPKTGEGQLIRLEQTGRVVRVLDRLSKHSGDESTWTRVLSGPRENELVYYDRFKKLFQIRAFDPLGISGVVSERSRPEWDFDIIEPGIALAAEERTWIAYKYRTGTATLFRLNRNLGEIEELVRDQPIARDCSNWAEGQFRSESFRLLWACYQSGVGRMEFFEPVNGSWVRRYQVTAPPNSEEMVAGRFGRDPNKDSILLYNSDMGRLRIFELARAPLARTFLLTTTELDIRTVGFLILPEGIRLIPSVGEWSEGAQPRSEILLYNPRNGLSWIYGADANRNLTVRSLLQLPRGAHELNALRRPRFPLVRPRFGFLYQAPEDQEPVSRSLASQLPKSKPNPNPFPFLLPSATPTFIPIPVGEGGLGVDFDDIRDQLTRPVVLPKEVHLFFRPLDVKVNTVLLGFDGAPYDETSEPSEESGFPFARPRGVRGFASLTSEMGYLNQDFQVAGIRFSLDQVILLRDTQLATLVHTDDGTLSADERRIFYDGLNRLEEYSGWLGTPTCLECVQRASALQGECQWGAPEDGRVSCDGFARGSCVRSCPQTAPVIGVPRLPGTSLPYPRQRLVQFIKRTGGTGSSAGQTWGFARMTDASVTHEYFPAHEFGHFLSLAHSHLDPFVLNPDPVRRGATVSYGLSDIPQGQLYWDLTRGQSDPDPSVTPAPAVEPLESYCDDEREIRLGIMGNCLLAHQGEKCSVDACANCVIAELESCRTQWTAACVQIALNRSGASACGASACRPAGLATRSFKPAQTNVMAYGYGACIRELGGFRGFTRDQSWRVRKWLILSRPEMIVHPEE